LNNKQETFQYDPLNRLTHYNGTQTVFYDSKGNITYKDDAGTLEYNTPGNPYAISNVLGNAGSIPPRQQDVAYTSFRRPASIEENGYRADFTYLPNYSRAKMQLKLNNSLVLTRYYLGGNYEKETDSLGVTTAERIYVGGTPYSAPAVLCKEAGQWKLRYIHRDHLGSITQLSGENGIKLAEYSYDPWGRLRDPQTLIAYAPDSLPALYLERGYTGHEHLPWFGLINMNARLYDPVLGRMLSPDPYVPNAAYSQDYNRYMYARNNPLSYIDPTGEIVWFVPVIIGAVLFSREIETLFQNSFGMMVGKV
jgi:RHS repeat-associated protein